jgi:hypothetical protein
MKQLIACLIFYGPSHGRLESNNNQKHCLSTNKMDCIQSFMLILNLVSKLVILADFVFDKGMGHRRAHPWPWPYYLDPVSRGIDLFEGCRWPDQSINAWELEPAYDWLPVSLWFGTSGLLSQVDIEALIFLFATFGSYASIKLTRTVWCRESAMKTKQTVGLTISICQFGIGSVVWHGFEYVSHEPLAGRNECCQFEHALRGHKRFAMALGGTVASRRIAVGVL